MNIRKKKIEGKSRKWAWAYAGPDCGWCFGHEDSSAHASIICRSPLKAPNI